MSKKTNSRIRRIRQNDPAVRAAYAKELKDELKRVAQQVITEAFEETMADTQRNLNIELDVNHGDLSVRLFEFLSDERGDSGYPTEDWVSIDFDDLCQFEIDCHHNEYSDNWDLKHFTTLAKHFSEWAQRFEAQAQKIRDEIKRAKSP